ncbi:MAG: alpha/beta hydrolase-fold protein [Ectothiorhodospiraceae bacterium]|jgi:metallo-beta-lactamase class B
MSPVLPLRAPSGNRRRPLLRVLAAAAMLSAPGLYGPDAREPMAGEGPVGITAFTLDAPSLGRQVRVWVYLPPCAASGGRARYPAVYMQDGQYLFDPVRARGDNPYVNDYLDRRMRQSREWYGSWQLDRRLDGLFRNGSAGGAIIVGVASSGSRTVEYSPWPWEDAPEPAGDRYVAFLTGTLKPYVDAHFPTLADRSHTVVAGSSMGGVIAIYAGLKRQDVFSGIAALSPVLSPRVWGERLTGFVRSRVRAGETRVYVDIGTREPGFGPIEPLERALRDVGFTAAQLRFRHVAGGAHRVEDWGARFPRALTWLLQPNVMDAPGGCDLRGHGSGPE